MASGRGDGPVYYREIQKNAYLKRIPNDLTSGKLRPLGSKKVPLKAMWTQFCVHNGRTPYLEQYPEAESPATLSHKPLWRACLLTARHVTASVKPHSGDQYDFLIDTDNGAIRMLAPDWESMQDWVTTLRNTLHELKILSKGENVYCVAPAALPPPPPPRAAARDPTSPLPPTPPTPPDRVPGIELTPNPRTIEPRPEPTPVTENPTPPEPIDIDISNWDNSFTSLPSTSQVRLESEVMESRCGVTKICGQNICLDDSLFKRSAADSDEEFFNELDKMSDGEDEEFKQRVVVSNGIKESGEECGNQATNVTVIQVSNKGPPHTAIPVLGQETNVFDFDFKQKLTITDPTDPNFVNIVNTENDYGTTFGNDTNETEYGHLSLTTTVNLSGINDFTNNTNQVLTPASNNLAVTSNNLAVTSNNLAVTSNNLAVTSSNLAVTSNNLAVTSSNLAVTSNNLAVTSSNLAVTSTNLAVTSSNLAVTSSNLAVTSNQNQEVYERLCMASTSNSKPSPLPVKKLKNMDKSRKSSLPNLEVGESTYEYLFLSNNNENNVNTTSEVNCNGESRVHVNSGSNSDPVNRVRSIERSRSQNACDSGLRTRQNVRRRVQNNSPKRENKNDNIDQTQSQKPIWKRGLTELSLLTRLKSLGQAKKQDSATQDDNERSPVLNSSVKVVHRSRPEARVDSTRRRSSSLSNGQSPVITTVPSLITLRARQAAALKAEQRRGAALVATISVRDAPVFADYDNQVWVCWWGGAGARAGGRAGDRVAALRGRAPSSAQHALALLHVNSRPVDILFHRVPLGKIYVVNKRDQESIGIKLDAECNIVKVDPHSCAARAGIPPTGHWALTEINNRPINLLKGGEDDMHRLSKHGTEVSILIQPSALVKKLRSALKGNKSLLGLR